MLIKKTPDIRSSEITPKDIYLRRREFIQGSAAALVGAGLSGMARRSRGADTAHQAAQREEEPAQHHGDAERVRLRDQLQQLLRVRSRRRRRSEAQLAQLQEPAVEPRDRRVTWPSPPGTISTTS